MLGARLLLQSERRIVSSDPSRTKNQALHGQHLSVFSDPRTMMLTYTHGLCGPSIATEIGAWILGRLLLTAPLVRAACVHLPMCSLGLCPVRKAPRTDQCVPSQARQGWVKPMQGAMSFWDACFTSLGHLHFFSSLLWAKSVFLLTRRWKGKGIDQNSKRISELPLDL